MRKTHWLLRLSARTYAWLLRAYPAEYRRDYGEPMAAAFRDLCRATYRDCGAWGLLNVWLRVLADTAISSIHERGAEIMAALKKIFLTKFSSDTADRKFGMVFSVIGGLLIMPLVVHKMTLLGFNVEQMVIGIACASVVGMLLSFCGLAHAPRGKTLSWLTSLLQTKIGLRPANTKIRQYIFFGISLTVLIGGVFGIDALKLSEGGVLLALLGALAGSLVFLLCGLLLSPPLNTAQPAL